MLGRGVHLDSPDSRSRSNIQDALRVLDRGAVQLPAQHQAEYVVGQIETVLLLLVVGQGVCPLAVCVVAAPIFIPVVQNGGGDGHAPRPGFRADGGIDVVVVLLHALILRISYKSLWGSRHCRHEIRQGLC